MSAGFEQAAEHLRADDLVEQLLLRPARPPRHVAERQHGGFRLHPARADGVDGDAFRPELVGGRPHEPEVRVLAGHVGGELRDRGAAPDRGGQDDAAAGLHLRQRVTGHQERAVDVDVDDAAEGLLDLRVRVGQRGDALEAGVVDQHVEPPDRRQGRANRCGVGDVAGQGMTRRAGLGGDRRGGRLDARAGREHVDLGAGGGETARDGLANAAAGTGHQHRLAGKVEAQRCHVSSPVSACRRRGAAPTGAPRWLASPRASACRARRSRRFR